MPPIAFNQYKVVMTSAAQLDGEMDSAGRLWGAEDER